MSPKQLAEMCKVLRSIRPLRRRDLAAKDGGWVPTDEETWDFQSAQEIFAVVAAWHLVKQNTLKKPRYGPLLLGTTLRLAGEQSLQGPLWTSSVGVEWAHGPAADPLQLGLRLGFYADGRIQVDLSIGSGGWSPWAEQWALEEDTLSACITVVAILPDGEMATVRTDVCEVSTAPHTDEGSTGLSSWACEVRGGEALREALASRGEVGIPSLVSVGSIRWQKEPPEWCPMEIQELALNPRPVEVCW